MDDEVYALLTRLMALSPEGDAGRNALVRNATNKIAVALGQPVYG
jgi:hypothetical protein